MILLEFVAYTLIGAVAGSLAGMLGIGGGIIIVPALSFIFTQNSAIPQQLTMQIASGTSLASMLFTAPSSIRAHARLSGIHWQVFIQLLPGICLGTLSGAFLADRLETSWLKLLFGLFLIFIAMQLLKTRPANTPKRFPPQWLHYILSYLIGFKSGLLGLGGGTLIVPYLHYCGVELRKIVPLSALCSMTVAVLGTLTFMATGAMQAHLPAYSTGYVYWPAVLGIAIPSFFFAPSGAKLSYVLPVKQLRYGFVLIVILTAIRLLV